MNAIDPLNDVMKFISFFRSLSTIRKNEWIGWINFYFVLIQPFNWKKPVIQNKWNTNDKGTTFSHFPTKLVDSKTSKSIFFLRMKWEMGSIWTLFASSALVFVVCIIIYCLRLCKKCLSFVISKEMVQLPLGDAWMG